MEPSAFESSSHNDQVVEGTAANMSEQTQPDAVQPTHWYDQPPVQTQADSHDAPLPPAYLPPFATATPVVSRRRGLTPALLALLMLALLAVGIGIGAAVNNSRTSHAQAGTGNVTISTNTSALTLPASVQDLQQTIITVVHADQPSVVEVQSSGGNGSAIGSGEFLTKDGYVVTNAHVVQGFTRFSVLMSDGSTKTAQLIGSDTQDDLAVLKVAITNATPIVFADSSKVQLGQFAVAIGSPLGLDQSASFGVVSGLNRTEQENTSGNGFGSGQSGPTLTGLIQTSAAINPGNSGGALVDLQGRLLGITTLGASGTQSGETISGIGFAIPANRVQTVVAQLMKGGQVTTTGQGFLGIQGEDVTPDIATQQNLSVQQGVLIGNFSPDAHGATPAQSAGLHTGDVIISANGHTVAANADLASVILNLAPGTKVQLTVVRGTAQQTFTVTLGERPIG